MKTIPLTQGKVALVDDLSYEKLNQYKWCAVKKLRKNGPPLFYAVRGIKNKDGKQKTIAMHNMILTGLDGFELDHIDGDGLNNQKSNLRLVTHRENCQNKPYLKKASKYPGVHFSKGKWRAVIMIHGKTKSLGPCKDEEEAHQKYMCECKRVGTGENEPWPGEPFTLISPKPSRCTNRRQKPPFGIPVLKGSWETKK